ncbi:MAG: riboflavin synthase [Chitinophagaceae bacterium]|nr:riboflavin synthase [Chitinophagaceae bacterium]
MFTGIVESLGTLKKLIQDGENLLIEVESPISHELKIDQSVAHNGICMTITAIENNIHTVCAVPETISKTTLKHWKIGMKINLERCIRLQDRLDGHLVQGHVDSTALCIDRIDADNFWTFKFDIHPSFSTLMIEKGSICINGTSLTCFNISATTFEVAIIPYTFEHTSIAQVHINDLVNIEFDVIGKYILRHHQLTQSN